MKGMMKLQWATMLVLAVLGLSSSAQSTDQIESVRQSLDSLMLVKHDETVGRAIHVGDKIKVWQGSESVWKGNFGGVEGDSLRVMFDSGERWVPINEIKRIKVYSDGGMRAIGALFVVVGTGALFFGGLSLVVGVVGLITEEIGAILLVAVPFLGGGGFGLLKLGQHWHGRRYKLNNKWRLVY